MKHFGSIFAVTVTLLMAGSMRTDPIYPDVVNTSHATPEEAAFFKSYFYRQDRAQTCPDQILFLGSTPQPISTRCSAGPSIIRKA